MLNKDCEPVAKGLVELWHADETGNDDNSGYKLRGHQFTGAEGRWWSDTIVPGLYSGRTRHFHIKVGQKPMSSPRSSISPASRTMLVIVFQRSAVAGRFDDGRRQIWSSFMSTRPNVTSL